MNIFSTSKIIINENLTLDKIFKHINSLILNESQLLYFQKSEFNEFEKFIYDLAEIHLDKKNAAYRD